jgi:P-aminobenzoate N-oxygenase AurF
MDDPSRFTSEALVRSVFRDDYGLEPARLEMLYSKSKRHQWNAEADVDWGAFDPDTEVLDPEPQIFSRLRCVQELPEGLQRALYREIAIFNLSQIMHGEQAALMVCGQLVNAVPDMDAKLGAAVQVMDEARHTEVFARYLNQYGRHYPIDSDLQAIVSTLLAEPDWEAKCVGMQIILESVALGFFRLGEKIGKEPVFREFIRRVHEDEARHVAYGVLSLEERIPALDPQSRRRLEDFAYDAVYRIAGRGGRPTFTSQFQVLGRVGIDSADFLPKLFGEFARPEDIDFDGLADPMTETVLPNLMRVGLIPERHLIGYLAQGWRIDLADRVIEDIHTFHPDTQSARTELAEQGKSVAAPA